MRDVAGLLNGMRDAGVISDYALFEAAAQMRYTEAIATLDADVLVVVPPTDRLDVLGAIYEYCRTRGYEPEGEAVRVGAWPVQFMGVFSDLTREGVSAAETADFDGVPFRVVGADYLAVIALSVGRAKDMARVLALLESGAATPEGIRDLAHRHGLQDVWTRFRSRFLDERGERLLRRQAEWQVERQKLSWPEKIRQAEQLRGTLEAFRAQRGQRPTATAPPAQPETSVPPEAR